MIKKLFAIITLLCFAHVSFGAPCVQGALELAAQIQAVSAVVTFAGSSDDPFNLRLPSTLGRVTGGRNAGQGPLVINIQDLHCHAEVQRNISGILQFLDTKYGLRDVFVEGGYGRLNTAWLDGIADPGLRKQTVNTLLESGRLGGSEYYAITNGRHDLLTGLEDERLHKANIVRLGSILERQPRFEAKIRELRRDLVVMKARYLSAENKRLDNIFAKYRAGNMTDARLYALLSAYINKIGARPDAYHSLQVLRKESFPTVQLYRETLALQKHLRYSKVSAQLTAFMGTLKTRLSFAAYNDLLTSTDNLRDLDALAPALARVSRDHQLNVARYPDLAQFIAYREKTRAVNPMVLLRETRRMTDALRSAFARNSAERDIAFLCDTFDCFEDYLLNRLTAEDYAYFKPRFEQFSSLWGAYTYTNHIRDLAPDFPLLDAYYAANDRRNGVFIDTMAPLLRPHSSGPEATTVPDIVVMVSGGFHTDGIARLLAERNISYCTVTPAVTRPAHAARHVFEQTISYQSRLFGAQALNATPLEALHPAVQVSPDGLVTVSLDGGARFIVNGDAFTVEVDIAASAAASAARGLDFAAVQRNAEIIMRLLLTRQTPLSLVPALYELVDICGEMLAQKGAAGTGLLWDIASNPAVQQALADKGTSLNSISTWLEPLQALAAGYAVTQADMRTLRDDPATNSIVRAVLRVPYAIETLGALHVFKGPAGAEDFPRGLVIDASGYTVEQMSVEEYNTVNQADCSDLFGHYTFCVNINAETKTMTVISNSGYVNFEASELEEVKRRVVFLSSLFNRLQAGYRNDYDLHDIEVSEYLNIDYYPFTSVDTLSTTLYGFCAMPGPLSAISGTNFWERSSMGYVVNPQPIFVSPLEYPKLALSLSDIQSMSKNVRTEHRAKFIKWIVKYVQEKSVKPSILEIGCNVGRDLLALCDDEKWDLYGIDVEDGAIRTLRQNIDDLDMKGIDVARISIYSQNFADEIRREFNRETFDVILMFATFEHLQDPKKALRRINAMLRSGGAVAITALPDNGSLMTKLSGLASNADASKTTHCCIYSKESFEALARENGFTVLYYHGENNSFPGWEHTMFEEVLPFIRDGKWYFFGKPLPDGITFKSLFKDNDPPHYNVFHLPFRHGNASTAAWGLGNYKLYKRHRKHIERLIQKFFFETTRDDFVGNIDDAVAALNDHLFNTLILDNPTGITDDDFETLLACKNDEAKLREIFQRKYFTIRNMWCYLIKETDVNLHSVAGATDTHAGQVISSDYRQAPEVSLMSQSGKGAVPDATIPPQVKLGIAAGGHALTTRSTYRLAGWIAGKLHLSFAQGLPSDWYTPENRAKHLKMARFAERVVAPLAVWDLPAHLMWSLWNIVRGSDVKKNLIRVVGAVAILSATAGLILLAGGFVPVQSWIDMLPYAAGLIPYAGLHRGYNKLFGTGTTTDAPLTIDGGGNKDIAQKEFVKAIKANYDIVVDDIRSLADWTPTGIPPMLVSGADGKQYVCRKIDGVFGKTIRRAREVIEYQQVLSDHGIAVARIHQTLNKNDFFIPRHGDDCYILEEYIPGETGSDMSMLYRMLNREAPASEQADNRREVIKWQLAAQLQNAVAGENLQIKSHHPPMEEGVVELNLAMKGLRVEISRAYSADSPEQQFFNAVAEVFERHYPRVPAKGLRGLPVSLIHGHMHLNSMQFDGEGNLVLLKNLEDVQVAPRVNEFINLLMPFDAVPDYHNFVTLITAYQAALDDKLSAGEILAIAHVVRFRLLHDIVKYFRKYDVLNDSAYENNRPLIMQAIQARIAGCEKFLDEFESNSPVLVRALPNPAGNASDNSLSDTGKRKNANLTAEEIRSLLEKENPFDDDDWLAKLVDEARAAGMRVDMPLRRADVAVAVTRHRGENEDYESIEREAFVAAVRTNHVIQQAADDEYLFINIVMEVIAPPVSYATEEEIILKQKTVICRSSQLTYEGIFERREGILPAEDILFMFELIFEPTDNKTYAYLDLMAIHPAVGGKGLISHIFPSMISFLSKYFYGESVYVTCANPKMVALIRKYFNNVIYDGPNQQDDKASWDYYVFLKGTIPDAFKLAPSAVRADPPSPAILPENMPRLQARINELIRENQLKPADERLSDAQIEVDAARNVARWERVVSLLPWFAWLHPRGARGGAALVTASFWGSALAVGALAVGVAHTVMLPGIGLFLALVAGVAAGFAVREAVHVNIDLHFIRAAGLVSAVREWGGVDITGNTLSAPVWMTHEGDLTDFSRTAGVTPVPLGVYVRVNNRDEASHQVYAVVTREGYVVMGFPEKGLDIDPAVVTREISRALVARDGMDGNPTLNARMRQVIAAASAGSGITGLRPDAFRFAQPILVGPGSPDGKVSFREGVMVVPAQSLPADTLAARAVLSHLNQVNVSMGKHVVVDASAFGAGTEQMNTEELFRQTGSAAVILTQRQIDNIGAERLKDIAKAGKYIYVARNGYEGDVPLSTYVENMHLAGHVMTHENEVTLHHGTNDPQRCLVVPGTIDAVRKALATEARVDPTSPVIIVLKPVVLQDGRTGILQLSDLMDVARQYRFDVLKQDAAFEQSIDQMLNPQNVEAILRAA